MIRKILLAGFVCAGMAVGQTAVAPAVSGAAGAPVAAVAPAPAKAYAFDVVSIRQNKSAPSAGMQQQFGPTPDGFRMTNVSLYTAILTAYVPQVGGTTFYTNSQIKGIPDWLMTERYDIDARISEEDRAEWQKPASQLTMLQAMLQAMLVERCKLAVHREIKEVAVYSLVVAKGGVKFKETDPTVEHPNGVKLPWGGVLVPPTQNGMSFYGASMASFASVISSMANLGHPVQDKTGLTGRYDLVLKFPDRSGPATSEQQGGTAASDPGSSAFSILKDLGLELQPAKGSVETLVIDHMERPSEN
jgi:uncharacterized protein (TIGR03435 family)